LDYLGIGNIYTFVILSLMRMTTKRLIFLGYFLGIFILKKIDFLFHLRGVLLSLFWELVLWFSGAAVGAYLIKIEQLIYVYFIHPNEILSLDIRELLRQNPPSLKLREARRREVGRLLRERVAEQKLAFRSALFQIVWLALAFFTFTSTASVFGKSLVMAVGLHLLLDEWEDVLAGKGLYWLFWQIKREVTSKEQKAFLWIMTGAFGMLSLLLI